MTSRANRYPPAGFDIRIPESLWRAALDEMRRYAALTGPGRRPGSEGLVYFGGIPTSDALMVTALFRLNHDPQGDCVKPTHEEVRWLLSELRHRDEKLVAQLHSHRHGASHSLGDNEMATSFHDGFLSIVVPRFAVGIERIDQCTVHEHCGGTFRALSTAETNARFMIRAEIVDRPCQPPEPSQWQRFAQKLKRTARARR